MARAPTGRPRGRPHGSRQYRGDDRLCIEMARLIQDGHAKDANAAARQVARQADGPTGLESKTKRLLRNYQRWKQWFVMRTKAPATPAAPLSIADYLVLSTETVRYLQRVREDHESFARFGFDFACRLAEEQRLLDGLKSRLALAGTLRIPQCELMSGLVRINVRPN